MNPASTPVCDAHLHVFGPPDRFPATADALYPPPEASLENYLELAAGMQVERFVIVQPSIYGRDNRVTLQALQMLGAGRARAVIDVDEMSVTDQDLAAWHAAGVRALRIHTHLPPTAGVSASWRPRLARLAAIVAELGWSIDFLMPGWLTSELTGDLCALRVDFTIAHMGYFNAEAGPGQPGFAALLALLRESPHCWIKLSGFYRQSNAPDLVDVRPLVDALLDAAPDRLLWGSDYPHVYYPRAIDTAQQLAAARSWIADEQSRDGIFGGNAARLYGL